MRYAAHSIFFAALFPAPTPDNPICVPDGECREVCEPIPTPPPGGQLISDSPDVFESDPLSSDDYLGNAEVQGGQACYRICNEGGTLEGPDGRVLDDGALGGECVEIYFVWTYRIWECYGLDMEILGLPFDWNVYCYWKEVDIESDTTRVCPCD